MTENKPLPAFDSIEQLVEFFENHDLGDYDSPEVEFEVDIQTREFLVPVEESLMLQITQMAQQKGVSSRDLVRGWLEEKVAA